MPKSLIQSIISYVLSLPTYLLNFSHFGCWHVRAVWIRRSDWPKFERKSGDLWNADILRVSYGMPRVHSGIRAGELRKNAGESDHHYLVHHAWYLYLLTVFSIILIKWTLIFLVFVHIKAIGGGLYVIENRKKYFRLKLPYIYGLFKGWN